MIYDNINKMSNYAGYSRAFEMAAAYLKKADMASISGDDVEIDGRRIYAMRKNSALKSEELIRFENHLKYIDIHYMLEGCEEILHAYTDGLEALSAYDPEADIAFYKDGDYSARLVLRPGDFAVFFPGEAHKPGIACGGYDKCIKIVVKIAVEASE